MTTMTRAKRQSERTNAAAAADNAEARPRWAVLAFRVGAVVDGIMAVAMVYMPLWARILKLDDFSPSLRYQVDLGVGAALMFGWTGLLLWGARKPVERRGVLLLTAFPVISGILVTAIAAVLTGLNSAAALTTILVGLPLLLALMVVGYLDARRVDARHVAQAADRTPTRQGGTTCE